MSDSSGQVGEASKVEGQERAIRNRSAVPPVATRISAPLNSCSEFGRLRAVVVGSPVGANHPIIDRSFANFFTPPDEPTLYDQIQGPISQRIVSEIQEDVKAFTNLLTARGIEVLRPEPFDSSVVVKSPDWQTDQLYSLMPRDCLFVHHRLYIEVPSPTRARFFESLPFRHIARAYEQHASSRALVLSALKPRLLDDCYDLSQQAFLRNTEPLFDGANCVRVGKDIFMDINNSANLMGLRWLQGLFNELGWGVTVHPMHIGEDHADVTLVPLRPGVILVDAARVTDSNLPDKFRSWHQIRVVDIPEQSYALPYPMASNGIGRNVFMLDEQTAVVEENQHALIQSLESLDFEVIPLRYRHGRTLGGSWHCITLDTNRDGGLEDYF